MELNNGNDHSYTAIGFCFGLVGGVGKYLLQVRSIPPYVNILQAVFTAFLCGAAGIIGKECIVFIKKRIIQKNKKSK